MDKEFKTFKEALLHLIGVRKIIALSITTMFIYLVIFKKGTVDKQLVQYIVVAVISYYFAKSTALDDPAKDPLAEDDLAIEPLLENSPTNSPLVKGTKPGNICSCNLQHPVGAIYCATCGKKVT